MTLENLQAELDELKQMIREAETLEDLNDLQHKVGGSPEEEAAAIARMAEIDAIDHKCAWDKFEHQLTDDEHQARAKWHSIMNRQAEYENKYC
jgi:hypothetical protein